LNFSFSEETITFIFRKKKMIMETLIEIEKYSVSEFLALDTFEENFIYELLDGQIVQRSSPHYQHQSVIGNLFEALKIFVREKKSGTVLFAPIDVYLDEENYVVPDLIYLSEENKNKLSPEGYIKGSPDIIAEVLSPSTAKHDKGDKMKIYKKHRVAEYWLIDPKARSVEIYVFRQNDYDLDEWQSETGIVKSTVLPGFTLNIESLFV
jgi:Uma2 family endonuclease